MPGFKIFAPLALIFSSLTQADVPTDRKCEPIEPLLFSSEGSIKIDGKKLRYDVEAGQLKMLDSDGKPVALFGFTSYTARSENPKTRPILFAFNGGPGSASVWLHMGILGPQRTIVSDTEFASEAPFDRVENEYSVLDVADLVMIDPVGTGFSRPVCDAEGQQFWGVDNDIESVSNFIMRWVTENGRWQAPKYILGESYGGIRSGGVAYDLLGRHNIALNGVILVSPFMDYVAGNAGGRTDLPYVNYFSTFAATAWYHKVSEYRPDSLDAFLAQVERFVEEDYMPHLFLGSRASKTSRAEVTSTMQRFTGISAVYWDAANLRINEATFAKELLRNQRKIVGRIDSRFVGYGINHISERFSYDPFFPAVGPAFVATFNDYYREELGVDTDMQYVTSAGLYRDWDWAHREPDSWGENPSANTAIDLNYAMIQNPHMRVLVQQGYYDLATPYAATDYFINQMKLPGQLRKNLVVEYYEAGHMMYLHPPSMRKFKEDLAAFLEAP